MAPVEDAVAADYSSRWEREFWAKEGGLKPGQAFDAGRSSPALTDLLASGKLDVSGETRVFVPGCGRGYDVATFVRAGAGLAVGLELAPTAQKAACQYLEGELSGEEGPKAQVYAGDFFKWEHPSQHAFDLGFDYTFLCALHPSMRADWAAAWARYLRPGGRLACICFPLDPEKTTGPPWPVDQQLYKDLLLPHGFQCELEQMIPPELSHPGRAGKECMMVFKRQ